MIKKGLGYSAKRVGWLVLAAALICLPLSGICLAQDNSADLFDELETEAPKKPAASSDTEGLFDDLESGDDGSSGESDLFGDLEGTTDEPEVKETAYRKMVRQVWENQEASLRVRHGYFPDEFDDRPGLDNTQYVTEGLFRFASWFGSSDLKLKFSGWAEYGTQDDTYRGSLHWPQDQDYYRRIFELNELYAVYSMDTMDLTVGKKEFPTGISTLFSPSDRFRPADLHDPLDPKALGIWQIKSDYYLDTSKFEFAFIPIYTFKKYPAPSSRWWGEEDTSSLGGLAGTGSAGEDLPNVSWEYIDIFAKYKTTLSGWDVFLSANTGTNPYTVRREENGTEWTTVNRIFTLAGGFSTTKGKFEIHGETLYNFSDQGRDDDYIGSVLGFTYTIDDKARYIAMEQVIVTLEYAYEWIVDKQSAEGYTSSSRDGRAGLNEIFARLQFKYNEDLKFKNFTHFRIYDMTWMNRVEVSYRFFTGLTAVCAFEVFESEDDDDGGGSGKDLSNFDNISYAEWDKNDRIILSLKYEF
ncbi:MAG TPA: hypothetical protein DHV36_01355 [Desulfobacteraceae bacterium]|nr:hypothetical protein [Desulfobacteraceae bacterium]